MKSKPKELDFTFWVAYRQIEGKKNYLGDGKGHLRAFRTEKSLREYLQQALSPVNLESVVVHSIVGQLAIPETEGDKPTMPRNPISFTPISTLAAPTRPTSLELMQDYIRRHKRNK